MNNSSPSKRILGILLFGTGILLGTLMTVLLVWAGLEAAFYVFQYFPGDILDGLACPPLMTAHETGTIVVDVNNPAKEVINPIIRVDISTAAYGAPDTREKHIKVEPGETMRIEEPITANNIVLGSFIFAKAYRYIAFPLTEASATCGVFVVNVPFLTGMQLFVIWLAFILISIPIGLWLWSSSLQTENAAKALNPAKALSIFVLASLFFSISGFWVPSLLCLVVTLIMFGAMFQFIPLR